MHRALSFKINKSGLFSSTFIPDISKIWEYINWNSKEKKTQQLTSHFSSTSSKYGRKSPQYPFGLDSEAMLEKSINRAMKIEEYYTK